MDIVSSFCWAISHEYPNDPRRMLYQEFPSGPIRAPCVVFYNSKAKAKTAISTLDSLYVKPKPTKIIVDVEHVEWIW